MKFSLTASSSRRKSRKAHFTSTSTARAKLMSSPLNAELKQKYNVNAVPIRKDDEVSIVRGTYKGREGKVIACYRRKWVIHIDRITREKANGSTVQVGIDPSKVVVTKLKMDPDRKNLLDRKNSKATALKGKGKYTADETMADVD